MNISNPPGAPPRPVGRLLAGLFSLLLALAPAQATSDIPGYDDLVGVGQPQDTALGSGSAYDQDWYGEGALPYGDDIVETPAPSSEADLFGMGEEPGLVEDPSLLEDPADVYPTDDADIGIEMVPPGEVEGLAGAGEGGPPAADAGTGTDEDLWRRPPGQETPAAAGDEEGRTRGEAIGRGVGRVIGFLAGALGGAYAGFAGGIMLAGLLAATPLAPLAPIVLFGTIAAGVLLGSKVGGGVGGWLGEKLGGLAGKLGAWLNAPA